MKNPKIILLLPFFAALLGCTLPLVWGPGPTQPPPPSPPLDVGPVLTRTEDPTTAAAPQRTPDLQPTPIEEITPVPSPAPIIVPTDRAELEAKPYALQTGSPAVVPNFAHPEFGCNWLGLGGQVFSFTGKPEQGKVLEVNGTLAGVETRLLSVTGGNTIYGEGGYEFTLAQQPVDSVESLFIQLFDIDGKPLSDPVYFDTFDDCDRNLILINFVGQSPGGYNTFFPLLIRN